MAAHTYTGNCWHTPYCCKKCRQDLCDVCRDHSEPRGECTSCPHCAGCEEQDRLEEIKATIKAGLKKDTQ